METLNYSKIKIARKALRMSMDDLVVRMGNKAISKNSISKIERGLLRPSDQTLAAIAEACNVPLSFFFERNMSIGDLDFRFAKNTPTKRAEQIKSLVISAIHKYFSAENMVNPNLSDFKLPKKKVVKSYDDAEQATIYLRKKLEIGSQPIFSVYELLILNGVHVIEIDIDDLNILGLSTLVCDNVPVIIINSRTNTTTERKRFTALHELAHLVLNIQISQDGDADIETQKYKDLPYKVSVKPYTIERLCHHFASAMLLPKECLFKRIGHIRTKLSLQELISIRNMYGISIAATVHRCHDLAIIDDTEYDNLYDNLINKNIMETGWGEYPIMEKADRMELLEERIKLEITEL